MQDPTDGGVWHKQTSLHFCAFIMPQDDHARQRSHRHRRRPLQEHHRHRRPGLRSRHRSPLLRALRQGLRRPLPHRRAPRLVLVPQVPQRHLHQPAHRLHRRLRRPALQRRTPLVFRRTLPHHPRAPVRSRRARAPHAATLHAKTKRTQLGRRSLHGPLGLRPRYRSQTNRRHCSHPASNPNRRRRTHPTHPAKRLRQLARAHRLPLGLQLRRRQPIAAAAHRQPLPTQSGSAQRSALAISTTCSAATASESPGSRS